MSGSSKRVREGSDVDIKNDPSEAVEVSPDATQQKTQKVLHQMVEVLGEVESNAIFYRTRARPAVYLDADIPAQRKLAQLLLITQEADRAKLSANMKEILDVHTCKRDHLVCEITWLIERLKYIVEALIKAYSRSHEAHRNPPGCVLNGPIRPTELAFYGMFKANLIVQELGADTPPVCEFPLKLSVFAYDTLQKYFPQLEEYMTKAAPTKLGFIGKSDAKNEEDRTLRAEKRKKVKPYGDVLYFATLLHGEAQGDGDLTRDFGGEMGTRVEPGGVLAQLLPPLLDMQTGTGSGSAMPEYELEQEVGHMQAIRTFLVIANNSVLFYTHPQGNDGGNTSLVVKGINNFSLPAHLQKLAI
jgi:hypothetical protein